MIEQMKNNHTVHLTVSENIVTFFFFFGIALIKNTLDSEKKVQSPTTT